MTMASPSLRRQAAKAAILAAVLLLTLFGIAIASIIYGLSLSGAFSATLPDLVGMIQLRATNAISAHHTFSMVALAVVAVAAVAAFVLATTIFRHLSTLFLLIERSCATVAEAARGDLNARVVRIGRTDEVGQLLVAVNRVLDLTEEFAKDTGAAMKRAGAKEYFRYIPTAGLRGDYMIYAELINQVLTDMQSREEETQVFEQSVKTMVSEVAAATRGIHQTANTMASRSENAGGHSLHVGEAAEVTTALAAAVSESTRQLASAINEIAQQVAMSAHVAQTAVVDIDETSARMTGLADSVAQIGLVVQLINDIASQTDLLALNATIEAARAGDAGKGFAVVAGEVKNLANQTARATDDISRQVASVQQAAHLAASGISGVVNTIRSIDNISATIAGAVQEQEAVTREIAQHIEEVATKAGQVSENVILASQASAHACGGTVRVIWSARRLAAVVESLNQRVNEYLTKVR
jgi:methyl-accepting chemotaxis protein